MTPSAIPTPRECNPSSTRLRRTCPHTTLPPPAPKGVGLEASTLLVATLQLARAVSDGQLSDEILESGIRNAHTSLIVESSMVVVDAINTFRVIPGVFACFRVLKSSVSAGDLRFRNGFDSRRAPHQAESIGLGQPRLECRKGLGMGAQTAPSLVVALVSSSGVMRLGVGQGFRPARVDAGRAGPGGWRGRWW